LSKNTQKGVNNMPSPKMKRLNKLHKIKKASERKPQAFTKVAKNVGLSVDEPATEPVVEEKLEVEEPVVEKVIKTATTRRARKTLKTDD
tara:strand:+ start:4087 stop:4353 length:267 start_codon:yes stop_codon:yes gene_type:complete